MSCSMTDVLLFGTASASELGDSRPNGQLIILSKAAATGLVRMIVLMDATRLQIVSNFETSADRLVTLHGWSAFVRTC